jgi:hypothetical protein
LYRFSAKNDKEKVNKKIIELRIGPYIYNPQFTDKAAVAVIDRPFTGNLFAAVDKGFFFQNESVFKAGIELGFVGPNSFAEETQKKFHKFIVYKSVYDWETQVKNAVAVQSHFLFSNKLFPKLNNNKSDFYFQSEADLGTVFTGVSAGFLTRIGLEKLVPIYDSSLYGVSVSAGLGELQKEFYFYIAPSIKYQVYDGTIQGSLFNDRSPITFDLIPIRFNGETGFKYRRNNLNLS